MAELTAPLDTGDRRAAPSALDAADLRKDFPLLAREVHGRPITYLDSAASSQRPTAVLDAMREYDETTHANVHRGVYTIAEEATRRFEAARVDIGRFIGAPDPAREVVFTKNATEALNLVAHAWGRTHLGRGDVVVLTEMEHHANIVPWHMLAAERGVELRWLPVDDDGRLVLDHLDAVLDGAKLLGRTCMSNVLGTLNPVADLAAAAHAAGALVVADACQSVPHLPTDVAALGVDFLAFSAHKMLGPTGIGVLWGREELLAELPPFLGGGAAVDYLQTLGMDAVRAHEQTLTAYAMDQLTGRFGDGIRIFGPAEVADRGAVISFAFRDVHPHDVSQILDQYGVCVRAGHHCAKPLMRRLGVNATARASFGVYNDEHDVDTLVEALDAAGKFFS